MVFFGYASKGEPDALLTLFVSLSILSWLFLMNKGRETLGWFSGYLFASLGFLSKGIPSFAFFLFAVFSTRMLKAVRILSLKHLVGIIGVLPAVLYLICAGDASSESLVKEVLERANFDNLQKVVFAYFSYPFRFFLSFFPWSLLGAVYLVKRKEEINLDRNLKILALFSVICVLTFWLFPGTRLRYLMPVFPQMSLVFGYFLSNWRIDPRRFFEIFRFFFQFGVPVGIVVFAFLTHSAKFTLKETVILLLFSYPLYFSSSTFFKSGNIVNAFAPLMLLLRLFYDCYFLPLAESKYPDYRKAAMEVAKLSSNTCMCSETRNLQFVFYVDFYRKKPIKLCNIEPCPLILTENPGSRKILKAVEVGKHKFYVVER
jgi:hypothetical protein